MPKKVFQELGVSLVETAIALPLILMAIIVSYDLTRIYIAIVMAQDVALMSAKLSNASDPDVDTPAVTDLIKSISGESAATTNGRTQFWTDQLNSSSTTYHGVAYYTDKELKTLNQAYGYLNSLNSDAAFPIPAVTPLRATNLNGEVNCSIYFTFADLTGPIDTTYNYSRIFYVSCAVPTWGISLLGLSIAKSGYIIVTRSAYAYHSGGLAP